MNFHYSDLSLGIGAAVISWSLIGIFVGKMTASHRLDIPNERSIHTIPVPVGAGIGIVATTLVLWPWWHDPAAKVDVTLLAGLAGIGALSWIDDRYKLSPPIRLVAQTLVVALCLLSLSVDDRVFPSIPIILERFLLGLAWVWFINLYNFMDGIDGLAGSEAVAVALGYVALFAHVGTEDPYWRLALVIAAATGGYLFWNWHPARVFMGDSGSIPLGFLLGWLMLQLALAGLWPAGLILPLYFVADATFTLFARLLRGEKPWQAHRQHFYQRAVLAGTNPSTVVCHVAIANAMLIALAFGSVRYPVLSFAAAGMVVVGLLLHFQRLACKPAQS